MNFPDFLSNRRKTETILDRKQSQNSKSQTKLVFKPGLFSKSKGSQPLIEIYREAKVKASDFQSPKAVIRKEDKSREVGPRKNLYGKGSFSGVPGFFKKQKSQSKLPLEIFNEPKITVGKLKDLCSLDRRSKKSLSKIRLEEPVELTRDKCLLNKKNSKNALKGKFFNTMNHDASRKAPEVKQKRLNLDGSPKTTECTKTLSFSKKKQSSLNVNTIVQTYSQVSAKEHDLVNPLLRSKLKNLEIRLLNAITSQKRGLE